MSDGAKEQQREFFTRLKVVVVETSRSIWCKRNEHGNFLRENSCSSATVRAASTRIMVNSTRFIRRCRWARRFQTSTFTRLHAGAVQLGERGGERFRDSRQGRTVAVEMRSGEGYFRPSARATVTLGENIFRVKSANASMLRLENIGAGNAPSGTKIPAGTKIGKSRSLIKLTESSRNFRCERLQFVGRRKVVNLSNSYDVAFSDCTFRRDLRDGQFSGGLTIDGDGYGSHGSTAARSSLNLRQECSSRAPSATSSSPIADS